MTLLAGLAGVAVAGGLLLIGAGLYGSTAAPRPHGTSRRVRALLTPPGGHRSRRRQLELIAGVAGGLLVLFISGLPVPALAAAALVIGIPALLRSVAGTTAEIDRLEALQTWVRRLSDLLTTNSELTKMLTESARTAPAPIAAPLADLGVRLDAGWSVEPALRILAEDLDSATGDMVVSALILGMRDRGGGLAEVLTRMADGVANDVSVRRSIESEREKPRATARIVILITLGVAAWFAVFNPGFLAPYSSPVGQIVLALICLYMAACLLWLKKLASNPAEARFLNVGGAA